MQLCAAEKLATTVYHNGTIYTVTEDFHKPSQLDKPDTAEVVATLDGKIVFVGSESEARAKGLVNRVVPLDALDAEVERLAGSILAKSAIAIRTGKGMLYKQLEMGLVEAYDYAAEVMACNMMSEDAGEGIDAFMQKREPNYTGR